MWPYKMELSSKLNEYCEMWKPEIMVSANDNMSDTYHFLPEASFGLRVLSLPASVCVSVRPCVR